FSLENTPRDQSLLVAEINLISENVNYTTTQYDILFNLLDTSGGVKVGIGYNTDLYTSETIDRLFGHYR
ncbi:hypothetical protein, partial [Dyadobacter sp. OTU695]|uniref:hypothetical protein n=1 Tax=Dyadobacter sp. OTU695 TaxID=3043860 RepID=UPI00313A8151